MVRRPNAVTKLILDSIRVRGFRSLGADTEGLAPLGRMNLIIGKNNSGKSNILRVIDSVLNRSDQKKVLELTHLDQHQPSMAPFSIGVSVTLAKGESGDLDDFNSKILPQIPEGHRNSSASSTAIKIIDQYTKLNNTNRAWFEWNAKGERIVEPWIEAARKVPEVEIHRHWEAVTTQRGGSLESHWIPESLRRIWPKLPQGKSTLIPAVRKIDLGATSELDFSGLGIIERLARLQNPPAHQQDLKEKFRNINTFLKSVTDSHDAELEIPVDRDTILVHMDSKTLPLDNLGTGLHEVIILAAAATVLESQVLCIEEPELHLHPLLQKKLAGYLIEKTTNQYFLTTHSSALLDTPFAEIFHVRLKENCSHISHAPSDRKRASICRDLGYRASDIVQSNCVIWVEGPSDRIYLNFWLYSVEPKLVEGIHYSIMFYGGRLASHLTLNDPNEAADDLVSLTKLNRNSAIVMDSDRSAPQSKLNSTKTRLAGEYSEFGGLAWITKGREIENYLPDSQIRAALSAAHPKTSIPDIGSNAYANRMLLSSKSGGEKTADKVAVARHIVESCRADLSILDLKDQVEKLVAFIKTANE